MSRRLCFSAVSSVPGVFISKQNDGHLNVMMLGVGT